MPQALQPMQCRFPLFLVLERLAGVSLPLRLPVPVPERGDLAREAVRHGHHLDEQEVEA